MSVKGRDPEKAAGVASAKPPVSGWTIQIGASDDQEKAAALLKSAKEKRAGLLASARPYTEAVRKGKGTLYRARFAGLEEFERGSRVQGAEKFRVLVLRHPQLIGPRASSG